MGLYVRLQTSFWGHRKTLRLRAKIGDAAFWIPPRLWCYAAENQPDGDFSDYSAEEIASLIGYNGDAKAMLEALQQASFMDGMHVHDWQEFNGYHKAFSDRGKKAAAVRWGGEKKGKDKTRQDKSVALQKHATSNATSIATSIPSDLGAVEGFPEAWLGFLDNRKAKKAPPTPRAIEIILRKLAERPGDAVEMLETAIQRNWTGIEWSWFDKDRPPRQPERVAWSPTGPDAHKPSADYLRETMIKNYAGKPGAEKLIAMLEGVQ